MRHRGALEDAERAKRGLFVVKLPKSKGNMPWNKDKEKVTFTMTESKILYMAGIWQPTEHYNQFTILTTAPNESMCPVHDRMPLILKPEEIIPWIQDWESAEKLLRKTSPLLERKQEYEQLSIFTI